MNDVKYMLKAISLAKKGIGFTSPNPPVGAVIVKNGKIIGEGYHKKAGLPHAEIEAINSATESVENSTMYVTLEPCCHYGKTPPCTQRIIKEKIKRVVISCLDPNPKVAGKGVKELKKHGIEVKVGVLEEIGKKVIRFFRKYILESKPYTILKLAMSLDGKIADKYGESKWITNEISRKYVHILRHKVDAIMVGTNTVLKDNPMLNVRLKNIKRQPSKVILDLNAKIPLHYNCFVKQKDERIMIVLRENLPDYVKKEYEKMNIEIIEFGENSNLQELFIKLAKNGITSLLVEGGSKLAGSLIGEELVDEFLFFYAPKIIGEGLPAITGWGIDAMKNARKLKIEKIIKIRSDILIKAKKFSP